MPQGVSFIERVRNREAVEDGDVSHVEERFFPAQIDRLASMLRRSGPEDATWTDAWIPRMRAQRARGQQAIQSYEHERSMVDSPICSEESSLHEAHVGMEQIASGLTGRRIGTSSAQIEIRHAKDTIEVEDRRRIASARLRPGGIGWCRRPFDGAREEKVGPLTWGRRGDSDVRNRLRCEREAYLITLTLVVVIVPMVFAPRGSPKAGTEHYASRAAREAEELTSRDGSRQSARRCAREHAEAFACHRASSFQKRAAYPMASKDEGNESGRCAERFVSARFIRLAVGNCQWISSARDIERSWISSARRRLAMRCTLSVRPRL